ncbi:Uncharacterised protein [Chlamydia trachomatis]|nr:Uncharacterised protein [Chlamydia trachomatis]
MPESHTKWTNIDGGIFIDLMQLRTLAMLLRLCRDQRVGEA